DQGLLKAQSGPPSDSTKMPAPQSHDSDDVVGGNRSYSAALNPYVPDDRSPPGLRPERLTGEIGLDELSDQLRIAVVEGMRARDGNDVEVRHDCQAGGIGNPNKWITQTGNHQRRSNEMRKTFQRRIASHRPEQRQASKCP